MSGADPFSQSYTEARSRFVAAAEAAGLGVESHIHPLPGRDGETLAMDVVRDGPAEAAAVLVVSSACHGIEGFCGSGVQLALLGDAAWQAATQAGGVAVLYIHALNPYGFSWWRRTTHENVDLNRNFCDFAGALPHNAHYDELAHMLVPPTWPPGADVLAEIAGFASRQGERALQQAMSGGQYRHPNGIFYGGNGPTWSNATVRRVLRDHGARCARLGWIDLHTGLGPNGVGEIIYAGPDDADTVQRARGWWGDDITSIYDGSSSSALITGMMWAAVYEECPQAEFTGMALEFGTLPFDEVMLALRADADARAAIKRQVRDAFYTDTAIWKERILVQSRDAAYAAVRGLTAAS